jgi:hypothetical protein
MNFKATASSIAASGGIRPDSHITARPVTATKAGPVALDFAGVTEGRPGDIPARSDLSPSSTLTGQRSYTDERLGLGLPVGATSRSGGQPAHSASRERQYPVRLVRNLGNPCAEKVRPHRTRQNNRCAHRSVRHHERPLPWKASRLRDSSAGFCLEETMGLRSGGSGMGGASYMARRHIFL